MCLRREQAITALAIWRAWRQKRTSLSRAIWIVWLGLTRQEKAVYEARSPINAVDQLSCPIIFLQGSEDKIVPPNQAETMVNALKEKGIPVAYLLFEGEQHGFRQAENIKRSLDAELSFYSQIFGFELADED